MSSYTPDQYAGWRDELLHRPYQVFTPDQAITALADVLDGDEVLAYGLVAGHLHTQQTTADHEREGALLDTTDLAHLIHHEREVLLDPYGDEDNSADQPNNTPGVDGPTAEVGEIPKYSAGFGQQQLPGWFRAVEPTMCGAEEPVPYVLTEDGLLALATDDHTDEVGGPGHCLAASHAAEGNEAVLE